MANVTAQERTATTAGISALVQAVADCQRHLTALENTVQTLRAGGWSGDASLAFQRVMDVWMKDFALIRVKLDEMRQALEITLEIFTRNEGINTGLTTKILQDMNSAGI